MSKKKVAPRELNNKLVVYICSKEWDTPLDMKVIQRKRINDWVAQSDCEIVAEFGDGDLDRAFEKAYDVGGRVIVANSSRLADRTVDFLQIAEDETKSFVMCGDMPKSKPSHMGEFVKLAYAMEMSAREGYLLECERWLN